MQPTPALAATALWSGLLIFVLVLLSARVVMGRRRLRVSLGDGGNREMEILSRTFANAAEYVPVGIAALILLALVGTSASVIHIIGGSLLAGRLIHPFGLAARRAPNPARILGMALTWLPLLGAAALLLMAGIIGR
ncbi:MAG: MAPEG family protein [Caulobacterales bacterium]|nr:MAPEG family protein [Caulobacterales bacterium]